MAKEWKKGRNAFLSNCDTGWVSKTRTICISRLTKSHFFVETYCGELEHIFTQNTALLRGTVFCTVTCIFEKVPTYCVMTWSCHNRCDTNLTQGGKHKTVMISKCRKQGNKKKPRNFSRTLCFSNDLGLLDLTVSIVKVDFRGIFDGFFKSAFSLLRDCSGASTRLATRIRVSKRNERNCESDSLNEEDLQLLKDFF